MSVIPNNIGIKPIEPVNPYKMKTILHTRLARRLTDLRGAARQKEIAAALGLKLCTYTSYEEGRAIPSIETLLKIRKHYRLTSIDELLED